MYVRVHSSNVCERVYKQCRDEDRIESHEAGDWCECTCHLPDPIPATEVLDFNGRSLDRDLLYTHH